MRTNTPARRGELWKVRRILRAVQRVDQQVHRLAGAERGGFGLQPRHQPWVKPAAAVGLWLELATRRRRRGGGLAAGAACIAAAAAAAAAGDDEDLGPGCIGTISVGHRQQDGW